MLPQSSTLTPLKKVSKIDFLQTERKQEDRKLRTI